MRLNLNLYLKVDRPVPGGKGMGQASSSALSFGCGCANSLEIGKEGLRIGEAKPCGLDIFIRDASVETRQPGKGKPA
jgi:hypothetical protein